MNWWLTIPSWLVTAYFGYGFVSKAGFPPKTELLIGDALFVGITLFFLFLPFFKKIKIGLWIELEREVKEAKKEAAAAKDELREFKNEVRQSMSVVSSNSIRQNINFGVPASAIRREGAEVDQNLDADARKAADAVGNELRAERDPNLALAKMRIDIELLLRQIIGASLKAHDPARQIKYLSINQMFKQLIEDEPNYAYLSGPMKVVLAASNAAMHAQFVSKDQADEALQVGAKVIVALRQHPRVRYPTPPEEQE